MQQLRILFYSDDRIQRDDAFPFNVKDLMEFVAKGLKAVVDVQIDFVHRHQDARFPDIPVQGANKLAWGFLSKYDELWIFGDKQTNRTSNDITQVEPYNEVDDYEVAVLGKWMETGGLLLTGDHSEVNPNPGADPSDHSKFISRGAALGRRIPRARQLRVWEGPPTSDSTGPHDNYNTIDGPDPSQFDSNAELQFDAIPQPLVNPSTSHKLFSWVNSMGQLMPIKVLPDHQHEGKVQCPKVDELNGDWPKNSNVPEIVAQGRDRRPFAVNREPYSLVVAFDGDSVNVGRIVADSSFHHYINPNLDKLLYRENGLPKPETDLDQIAQYYCNLALWLAPKKKRHQLKVDLFINLATHPLVVEARGMDVASLGRIAKAAARLHIGESNLFQILGLPSNEGDYSYDPLSNALVAEVLSADSTTVPASPSFEVLLGSVVKEFHDFLSSHPQPLPLNGEKIPGDEIINRALEGVVQQQ